MALSSVAMRFTPYNLAVHISWQNVDGASGSGANLRRQNQAGLEAHIPQQQPRSVMPLLAEQAPVVKLPQGQLDLRNDQNMRKRTPLPFGRGRFHPYPSKMMAVLNYLSGRNMIQCNIPLEFNCKQIARQMILDQRVVLLTRGDIQLPHGERKALETQGFIICNLIQLFARPSSDRLDTLVISYTPGQRKDPIAEVCSIYSGTLSKIKRERPNMVKRGQRPNGWCVLQDPRLEDL